MQLLTLEYLIEKSILVPEDTSCPTDDQMDSDGYIGYVVGDHHMLQAMVDYNSVTVNYIQLVRDENKVDVWVLQIEATPESPIHVKPNDTHPFFVYKHIAI